MNAKSNLTKTTKAVSVSTYHFDESEREKKKQENEGRKVMEK